MSNAEDIKQIRRLLARIVVLLGLLNVLVAVGLYFQFVPEPSKTLREILPVLLILGIALAVLAAAFGFVKLLVASQNPRRDQQSP
jgi:hypothetical protein